MRKSRHFAQGAECRTKRQNFKTASDSAEALAKCVEKCRAALLPGAREGMRSFGVALPLATVVDDDARWQIRQISEGSFSAVAKPIFSRKSSFGKIFKMNTPCGVWKSRSALEACEGNSGVRNICERCWIRRYNVHSVPTVYLVRYPLVS